MEKMEQDFEQKYSEYLEWKKRRDELIPEFSEPGRKQKENSWHYEDCSQKGIIVEVMVRLGIHTNTRVTETCTECNASRDI